MQWFKVSGRTSAAVAALSLAFASPLPAVVPAIAAENPGFPGADCTPGMFAADDYWPKPAYPGQNLAPEVKNSAPYQVQVIFSGLPNPRTLTFIDGGRALISAWPGQLRTVGMDGKLSPPLNGVPKVSRGRDGGFAIVLDPDFASNRTLYLAYRVPKPNQVLKEGQRPQNIGQVARARLTPAGDALEDVKVIYSGGYLRRIAVGKDGTLLLTSVSEDGVAGQKLTDPDGSVLRINNDGSIPKDNPFVSRKGAKGEIYDLGHRDADGIAVDDAGGIWTVEHGPRGGDELNLIVGGKNYGYPRILYGRAYSGEVMNGGKTQEDGLEQPVYFWPRSIGPGGLMIYSGRMFPEWKGSMFVGALATRRLVRLDMKDGKVGGEEHFLADRCQRVRDVREAPDGSIWVVTNDIRADKYGEVLRISRR